MEACVQFFCWSVFHSFFGEAVEGGRKGFLTWRTSMAFFSPLASAWAYSFSSKTSSLLNNLCLDTRNPGSRCWDEDIQTARESPLCFKDSITLGLYHPFSVLLKLFERLPVCLIPSLAQSSSGHVWFLRVSSWIRVLWAGWPALSPFRSSVMPRAPTSLSRRARDKGHDEDRASLRSRARTRRALALLPGAGTLLSGQGSHRCCV